jgi:putative secretion ATPase (PEP-CTERM system associated)
MYLDYYNLRGLPFQLNPDHRFFFESRQHKKAVSYLEYGLIQGEGFIVITGEVGTGKTTLIDHMLSQHQDENLVMAKVVTTQLEAEDFLRLVLLAFGVPPDGLDKATILTRFEAFLADNHRNGRRSLLFVDEAQNLPLSSLEELRMLSNFQADHTSLLQSILVGQPQFRQKLFSKDLEQLQQRVIAAHHLWPLDADETRNYIEHRLHRADWQGDPSFTDQALMMIHEQTGGVPRKINVLCNRLLIYGSLENLHRFSADVVRDVSLDLRSESLATDSALPHREPEDPAAENPVAIPEPVAISEPVAIPEPVALAPELSHDAVSADSESEHERADRAEDVAEASDEISEDPPAEISRLETPGPIRPYEVPADVAPETREADEPVAAAAPAQQPAPETPAPTEPPPERAAAPDNQAEAAWDPQSRRSRLLPAAVLLLLAVLAGAGWFAYAKDLGGVRDLLASLGPADLEPKPGTAGASPSLDKPGQAKPDRGEGQGDQDGTQPDPVATPEAAPESPAGEADSETAQAVGQAPAPEAAAAGVTGAGGQTGAGLDGGAGTPGTSPAPARDRPGDDSLATAASALMEPKAAPMKSLQGSSADQGVQTQTAPPATSPPEETPGATDEGAQEGSVEARLDTGADAQVVLRATEECWVEVRDASKAVLLSRLMRAGDSYPVPQQADLTLVTGNAGGLEIEVGGNKLAPLGPKGAVRRNISLNPVSLLERYALTQ